jgi:plasmid stabilization system protein ParE
MEIRWSPEAADDLAAIVVYIRTDDPAAAQRTAKEIYERAGALVDISASRQTGPRERHAGITAATASVRPEEDHHWLCHLDGSTAD